MIPREPTPRSSIDESKYIAAECPIHGWFVSGIRNSTNPRSLNNAVRYFAGGCPRCAAERKSKAIFEQSLIPPRFANKNFENYSVSGSCQQAVFETCKEFADKIIENIQNGRGLLLIGTPGTGKLTSDAQFSQRRFGKAKPHFLTTVGKCSRR